MATSDLLTGALACAAARCGGVARDLPVCHTPPRAELSKESFKPDSDGERKMCKCLLKLINDRARSPGTRDCPCRGPPTPASPRPRSCRKLGRPVACGALAPALLAAHRALPTAAPCFLFLCRRRVCLAAAAGARTPRALLRRAAVAVPGRGADAPTRTR